MTDIIHLLPDSVANQIAAGEVIQRPASVVKELVENSIDAGASAIQIVIKDAGRTLIQVIDNGCGMSVTDARMAFERHATSKIRQATDLFGLHTMGFRGEALPSIAAVSEIEMRTMRRDDTAGTRICISASKVESQQPDICTPGTSIMVKRLFFNLPARRKFLKKDPVELGHIVREFERLALVNTDVEFTISHNGVVLHQLPRAQLKSRICDLFGKILDHQLIPIGTDTSLAKIDGFVSLPANARRRNALQYFFVNGRNMRHPYFHKAVMSCYENLIPADTQPCYFINFTVDPQTIDVNIHPQKHEIKFENEQPLWQILSATIKESLGRFNASAAIDFEAVDSPDIPPFVQQGTTGLQGSLQPDPDVDLHFNPFDLGAPPSSPLGSSSRPATPSRHNSPSVPRDWDKLYASFLQQQPASQPASGCLNADAEADALLESESRHPSLLQIKNRYIATPSKSGLMLIDQYRAHVRILYEEYLRNANTGDAASQQLIFPETVTLDTAQAVALSSVLGPLASVGFAIEQKNSSEWTIKAVPAMIGKANPADMLASIIGAVIDNTDDIEQSQWQRIALSMARSAAIKRGTALSATERDHLISKLFRLAEPDYTPDGKPIIALIDIDDINKMF